MWAGAAKPAGLHPGTSSLISTFELLTIVSEGRHRFFIESHFDRSRRGRQAPRQDGDPCLILDRCGCGWAALNGVQGSQFHWAAYHAGWKQMTIDQAIAAMLAELAVLHAEMIGYTCSTAPLSMTLDVGKRVADRAERFVTIYMTPIRGLQHCIKVHRLLCHVIGATRMHGNINNGYAAITECLHKEDKPCYERTYKGILDFTRKVIVQAEGARIIQR